MTTNMVERPTEVYSMPLPKGVRVPHPEFAVIQFGTGVTVDIGILCYMKRTVPTIETRRSGRKVVLASLCPKRRENVQRLLEHISLMAETSGLRSETLRDRFSRLAVFVTWADSNNWPDVLSGEHARDALIAYLDFVRDRVTRNELSLNAGAKQQIIVVQAIGAFWEIDHLARGLNLLRRDLNTAQVTVPPSEQSQGRVLSLCEALFNGICNLVLGKELYPWAIAMPEYLNFPGNRLWIFPGTSWFKTPAMEASSKHSLGYIYSEGRVATVDELKTLYPGGERWRDARTTIRAIMNAANADFNHSSRWFLGCQAQNVYIILFIAATGMNWGQAISLPWTNQFDVGVSRQGFRNIKWRAGGKTVSFELPIAFLPAFKRYIELRTFLLQGRPCEYLFFKSLKASDPAAPYISKFDSTYKMLRRIDPTLDMVLAKEWRSAKSDWLVRNTDPSTTALVLQNSVKVVLKHYAEGSESLHHDEMGTFLGAIASVVITPGEIIKDATTSAVGLCTSFGEPVALQESERTKPNCRNVEGCLFCDKFKVHADETDTRKLLSCRYAINLVAPLSENHETFENTIQPILSRIDAVVSDIAVHAPQMVARIKIEVDEDGILDPYWSRKVEMLMTLGL